MQVSFFLLILYIFVMPGDQLHFCSIVFSYFLWDKPGYFLIKTIQEFHRKRKSIFQEIIDASQPPKTTI
jgi:hypothetical protein